MNNVESEDVLERCRARIRGRGLRVVFPEAQDERIVAAASELRALRLADPIVLSDPESNPRLDAYAARYLANRPDANPKIAQRLLRSRNAHVTNRPPAA